MFACPGCKGIGQIQKLNEYDIVRYENCNDCDGKGWVDQKTFDFIVYYRQRNLKKIKAEIKEIEGVLV
jgi:hypothetical protein